MINIDLFNNKESRRSLAFYFYDKIPPKNRLYERAYWKFGNVLR